MACRKRAVADVPSSVFCVQPLRRGSLKFDLSTPALTFGAPDARTRGICHSRPSWGLQCVVKARRGIGSSCVCRREKPCLDICVNSRITERSVGVRTTTHCLIRPGPYSYTSAYPTIHTQPTRVHAREAMMREAMAATALAAAVLGLMVGSVQGT